MRIHMGMFFLLILRFYANSLKFERVIKIRINSQKFVKIRIISNLFAKIRKKNKLIKIEEQDFYEFLRNNENKCEFMRIFTFSKYEFLRIFITRSNFNEFA